MVETRLVVGLAIVDGAAIARVNVGAAQVFVRDVLTDRRLDQGRPGEIQARSFGHQHGVAQDRQVRTSGDAVAHDGGILGNALRREDGVVAEDPAEVVFIGEDLVLHGQKNARRVDQVNHGQPVGLPRSTGPARSS